MTAEELERRIANCFDRVALAVGHVSSREDNPAIARLLETVEAEKAAARAVVRQLRRCPGCGDG